jgi:N-acetylglutamate synthase-like GNAT family acetyltransferase
MHVEQVSVHPRAARRGIGRVLLEHAAACAVAGGMGALTLTTFAQVPWNAPYYARCGFRVVDDGELSASMRAVRDREVAHGLHRWPRVCMRRDLDYRGIDVRKPRRAAATCDGDEIIVK